MAEHLTMQTSNGVENNISWIAERFQNCVTETIDLSTGKPKYVVDFDQLRQELSDELVEGHDERYQFVWPDKKKAILLANSPINATLRPCREKSVDFDTTQNLYIEGDNLDVLKCLKETYMGKVKMIYIDPPYNTGNDFVYNDDFAESSDEYMAHSGQFDEQGNRLFVNTESNGRFHTDWLNMIYPRLKIARELLEPEGAIFISIDDNEVTNLKKICDEIFGIHNYVDCITWNKRIPKNDNKGIGNIHEYILVYTKNNIFQRKFLMEKEGLEEIWALLEECKKQRLSIKEAEFKLKSLYSKKKYDRGITLYCNLDEQYRPWGKINMSWPNGNTFGPRFDVVHPKTGKPTKVPDRGWRWNQETFQMNLDYNNVVERYDGSFVCGNIWFAQDENTQPSSIKYLHEVSQMLLRSVVSLKSDGGIEVEKIFEGKSFFSYPKPVSLLHLLISSIEEKDGIFMDFFSGSGTTAHALLKKNIQDNGTRKFIMIQLPEETEKGSEANKAGYANLCEVGEERIRRAGKSLKDESPLTTSNIDTGFRVLKLDSSNMKNVYYAPAEVQQEQMGFFADNVKEDRTSEDLLFQVMLELGATLDSKIESTVISDKAIYNVADGYLVACFDDDVNEDVVKTIAKMEPQYAVFKDRSLADDSTATNFEQIFKTYSPTTTCKVL